MIYKAASLHCQKGTSNKVYYLQIVSVATESGTKYKVQYQHGRWGKQLRFGTKTEEPTSLANAENIFYDKLAKERKKGYKEIPNPDDLLALIALST